MKRGLEVVRAESHQTCSGWRGEMGAEDPLHLATPLPLVAITSLFLPFRSETLKIRRYAEQLSLRCCAEKRTGSRSGCPVRQRLVVTPEPAVGSSPGVTTQGPLAIRGERRSISVQSQGHPREDVVLLLSQRGQPRHGLGHVAGAGPGWGIHPKPAPARRAALWVAPAPRQKPIAADALLSFHLPSTNA